MLKRCALTVLMVVFCGMPAKRLSAQDCGFFWPCQRPAEPRLVPAPSAPPEVEYYRQPAQPGRRDSPEQRSSQVNPIYLRQAVYYPSNEAPGTIVVDPHNRFLYWVAGGGRAIRYGIGVGRQGFQWSGVATIRDKQEWPDWYPPKEMLQRQPEIMRQMQNLRSGIGMAGGPGNPLGARALYLWQGNKDTLYRIHGTTEPWTIGRSVSSGCIRMLNQDVIDLYQRTSLGAKVVVLGSRG
jgi:lipoprotein-anchoring transpeptidase ErfK/SrfK